MAFVFLVVAFMLVSRFVAPSRFVLVLVSSCWCWYRWHREWVYSTHPWCGFTGRFVAPSHQVLAPQDRPSRVDLLSLVAVYHITILRGLPPWPPCLVGMIGGLFRPIRACHSISKSGAVYHSSVVKRGVLFIVNS